MPKTNKQHRLLDTYAYPGFRPQAAVKGVFGDPKVRIVTLCRREKKGLRLLRALAPYVARPQDQTRARSVVWRHARLPGVRGPAGQTRTAPKGR